jgi:hypothetical protein
MGCSDQTAAEPNPSSDREPVADPEDHAEADIKADRQTDSKSHAEANPETDSQAEADGSTDAAADGSTDAAADGSTDAATDAAANPEADRRTGRSLLGRARGRCHGHLQRRDVVLQPAQIRDLLVSRRRLHLAELTATTPAATSAAWSTGVDAGARVPAWTGAEGLLG